MSEQETLTSIVEFSIALAGFSGIVVALGKQAGRWDPADRFRMLNILIIAFGAAFMAYVPMGLAHAGLSGSLLWRLSSGMLASFLTIILVFAILRMRSQPAEIRRLLNPTLRRLLVGGTAFVVLTQLANIVGLGFQPCFVLYFAALVWLLIAAALQFIRILFVRPS